MRNDGRAENQLRPISFERNYTKYAEGSVLVTCGDTKVLCNASVEERVPPHKKGTGEGWVTAEYSMLPRATQSRNQRDINKLKLNGRTAEIQRLIGRSLRTVVSLPALGERSITIDCDVLQADGGTRTASICGAWLALRDACDKLVADGLVEENPLIGQVAAISVGIIDGVPMLDLCYAEDSHAEVDMNVVMTNEGKFIELQGTGEQKAFDEAELSALLSLAKGGIQEIMEQQKNA